jgi:hypothetical protein
MFDENCQQILQVDVLHAFSAPGRWSIADDGRFINALRPDLGIAVRSPVSDLPSWSALRG